MLAVLLYLHVPAQHHTAINWDTWGMLVSANPSPFRVIVKQLFQLRHEKTECGVHAAAAVQALQP